MRGVPGFCELEAKMKALEARLDAGETAVLKEYLLRGSVRDQRIDKLEKRMTAAERSIDSIIYTLMPPLKENRKPIGFQ